MEQSTGGIRGAHTTANPNANSSPERRMTETGRAIYSNKEWFYDDVAAKVVSYDLSRPDQIGIRTHE